MPEGEAVHGCRPTRGGGTTVVPLQILRPLLLAAACGLLLVGCGDDESSAGSDDTTSTEGAESTGSSPGPKVVILAVDNSFDPEEETVAAGSVVVWENRGRNDHDIVPEDPDDFWAVPAEEFKPGDVVEFQFAEPGRYRYYCSIHGNIDIGMPGVLIVE